MSVKEMESDLKKLLFALNRLKGNPPYLENVHDSLQELLEMLVERCAEQVAIERGG